MILDRDGLHRDIEVWEDSLSGEEIDDLKSLFDGIADWAGFATCGNCRRNFYKFPLYKDHLFECMGVEK